MVPRPPGALKRIFGLVRVLKNREGFTESIGVALGLLTVADAPATSRTAPPTGEWSPVARVTLSP